MLVNYGSDSDSDNETPIVPSTAKSGLNLPPPSAKASSANVSLPAPKTGKRKERGPVKITLDDLPSVTSAKEQLQGSADNAAAEGPARKRPKFDSLGKGGGLASLLPAPKKSSVASSMGLPPPSQSPAASASNSTDASTANIAPAPSTSLLPPSLQKKAAQAAKTQANAPAPGEAEPEMDFFGFDSFSSSNKAPVASSSKSTLSSASKPSISGLSAPAVKEKAKVNYYSTLPPATPDDPYPGFHCLPSGQWAPNNPQEWAEWSELNGWTQTAEASTSTSSGQAPAGFDETKMGEAEDIQGQDPRGSKGDGSNIPEKMPYVPDEDPEETERKRAQLKQQAGRARGKNQLSSLLADAMYRREELEGRIAQAKQNKRAGGAKYGFF